MKKKIFIALLILLALAQFKRIDKSNPPIIEEQDFFTVNEAPAEIKDLIQTACYDCHSHTTNYPWYSNLSPVSWWLKDHITEGRSHMNFSTWAAMDPSDRDHALEECQEVLEEKEMPMLPYMIAHNEAWIDEEQRAELAAYFKSLQKQ